jgi:hypothetical protein
VVSCRLHFVDGRDVGRHPGVVVPRLRVISAVALLRGVRDASRSAGHGLTGAVPSAASFFTVSHRTKGPEPRRPYMLRRVFLGGALLNFSAARPFPKPRAGNPATRHPPVSFGGGSFAYSSPKRMARSLAKPPICQAKSAKKGWKNLECERQVHCCSGMPLRRRDPPHGGIKIRLHSEKFSKFD